jgi:hypothetical protein
MPEGEIAVVAQKATELSSVVIMVNVPCPFAARIAPTANRALAMLADELPSEIARGDPIGALQLVANLRRLVVGSIAFLVLTARDTDAGPMAVLAVAGKAIQVTRVLVVLAAGLRFLALSACLHHTPPTGLNAR